MHCIATKIGRHIYHDLRISSGGSIFHQQVLVGSWIVHDQNSLIGGSR